MSDYVAQPDRVKSTHRVEVVHVVMEKHPDADSLSVIPIFGYSYVGRTADWVGVEKAAWIPPDSLVDVRRPEFSFLAPDAKADMTARVKARRLRGIVSYGLLVPAPADANIGDDLAERLGVTRYEPEEASEKKDKFLIGGEQERGPDLNTGPNKYDVDAFERYHDVFSEGEPVYVSEKLDGSNCRFVFWDNRFWVKSRNHWVKRVPDYSHVTVEFLTAQGMPEDKAKTVVDNLARRPKAVNGYWQALEKCGHLEEYLVSHPGTVVFGEVYGSIARLKYGLPDGNRFAAFDVYRDGRFLNPQEMVGELSAAGVPMTPTFNDASAGGLTGIPHVPYSFAAIKALSEGPTTVPGAKAGVIREGVVVRPMAERWDRRTHRVILKCVNPDFMGMKG
jgi:RNA ligase (TIGR02306 family)